jgi:hypothetical protein
MTGVSRQLPNLFRLSASKLTLDVTIRGTAEQAERDFENRDIRAMVEPLHPSTGWSWWLVCFFHRQKSGDEFEVATLTMSPTTITALAAIFGSLSGGLASAVSTWIAQRHQSRHDLLARKLMLREQLYSDFISESTRALADAMQHNLRDASALIPTYALLSRIRLSSSVAVVESADKVLKNIVNTYAEPNLSPEEIRARAISGDDPLGEFSQICRRDLEVMQR